MPDNTKTYTSDKYITLNQITNRFSHDVATLLQSKQVPLVKELRKKGLSYQDIGDLLGVSRQAVHEMVKKYENS